MNNKRFLVFIYGFIMILLAVVYCSPLVIILLDSFRTNAEISQSLLIFPASFTIDNYAAAMKNMKFSSAFFNTIIITVISTAGIVLFGSMAAYAIQRFRFRFSRIIYPVFAFSLLIPFQTFMFPLVETAKNLGLIGNMGIIPVYWGLGCPLAVFIMFGFIKSLPMQWEEAAAIDGANPLEIFFTVVLPLLTPIAVTLTIVNVFWIWNDFLLPLILSPPTLQMAQYGFFTQFRGSYGPATASLVLTSLPIVVFYLLAQKHIAKSVITGAIRG